MTPVSDITGTPEPCSMSVKLLHCTMILNATAGCGLGLHLLSSQRRLQDCIVVFPKSLGYIRGAITTLCAGLSSSSRRSPVLAIEYDDLQRHIGPSIYRRLKCCTANVLSLNSTTRCRCRPLNLRSVLMVGNAHNAPILRRTSPLSVAKACGPSLADSSCTDADYEFCNRLLDHPVSVPSPMPTDALPAQSVNIDP